jgi:hypothetical protein
MLFNIKMKAFWGIAPCSIIEAQRCLTSAYGLHHQSDDDGGSTHLSNVGLLQQDYRAL